MEARRQESNQSVNHVTFVEYCVSSRIYDDDDDVAVEFFYTWLESLEGTTSSSSSHRNCCFYSAVYLTDIEV